MNAAGGRAVRSPASLQAARGRDTLEGCLLALRELAVPIGRAPVVAALDRARLELARLEGSKLQDPAHLERLAGAASCVRQAAQALASLRSAPGTAPLVRTVLELAEALEATRSATVEAMVAEQSHASPARPTPLPAERRTFRASIGTPAFHAVERAEPILAAVDFEPDDDIVPDPDDDLDRIRERMHALAHAEGPAAAAADVPEPAAGEADAPFVRRSARVEPTTGAAAARDERARGALEQLRRQLGRCMDEIGILGNLRRIAGNARWHERLPHFEQRLLNHLDALVSLGERDSGSPPFDLLAEVMAYAEDRAGHDFARAFARALLLGSVEGDDTARAAVLTLAQASEATMAAQVDALGLGSNPSLAGAALRLVALPSARHRQLGLELLAARRAPGHDPVLGLLEDPEPAVRQAAVRYIAVAAPRDVARERLNEALRCEEDDAVLLEALRGAFRCDPSLALTKLRMRLREAQEQPEALPPGLRRELVWLLGIAGGKQDGALLARVVGPDAVEVAALGWHGDLEHVARLMSELERAAAATADRASGDGPREPMPEAGEAPLSGRDPSPLAEAAALALCRITGARLPAFEDAPDPYRPTTDPERWRAWLAEHGASLPASSRLRFGQPFALRASLDELDAPGVPNDIREALAFELGIALGQPPLDVHGWVARQRAELGAMRAVLEAGPAAAAAAPPTLRRALLATGPWLGDLFGVT